MADPNFFPKSKKLTLDQISKLTKIPLPKSADKNRVFLDVSPLDSASRDNISFLDNKNYIDQFKKKWCRDIYIYIYIYIYISRKYLQI